VKQNDILKKKERSAGAVFVLSLVVLLELAMVPAVRLVA
jgi:hypothetical protein